MAKVYVASKSALKLYAVESALPEKYVICASESKSGVWEQPVGMEMIALGALNRLKCVDMQPCFGFETGMVKTAGGYYDTTCCILRTNLGDFYHWTPMEHMQKCPLDIVKVWEAFPEAEREKTTLGSLIPTEPSQPKNDDWYKSAGGAFSRREMLTHLASKAWMEFVRASDMMPRLQVKLVMHNNVPFIDIQENLANDPHSLMLAVQRLTHNLLFNVIVVLEARGFIFSGAFKNITNVKIVMARKPGKLPTDQVHSIAYTKEYGTDEICIAKDAIPPNSHVLLVDDVYATGNTMRAVETLVTTHFQSKVVAFVAPFAIETEPGKLLAKGQLAKVRYAQTQLLLPEWEAQALEEDDDDNTICIIPPSLHTFSPNKRAVVVWKQFSASSNITFNGQELENKKVVLYLNVRDQSELYEVLSLLSILYRKQPRSIKIILPFLEQGTQDRIEYLADGRETLAQVDTLGKMIGKHAVTTFDIHAEQSMFAFHNISNVSIVLKLWTDFHRVFPNTIAVFPDDGAAKRFGGLLGVSKTCVTFRKTRGKGDERKIQTDDHIEEGAHYVIVDDLVRSGSTLRSVGQYLLDKKAKSVYSLFAHAPFEPQACHNLAIFNDKIWTSNSCPEKVPSQWVHYRF